MDRELRFIFEAMSPEEDALFVLLGGVIPGGVKRGQARMDQALRRVQGMRQGAIEGRLSPIERAQLAAMEIAREQRRLLQEVAAERITTKAARECVAA